MFDDLHDPDPPTAGLDALARVSERAGTIRRRRTAMLGGGAVAVAIVALAIVIPGRDADRIEPADDTEVTASTSAPVPDCGRLTDPVWLPNGAVAGEPDVASAIDPSSGEFVETRTWADAQGNGVLAELPAPTDVLDLPPTGNMWGLRVTDEVPGVDSHEVVIWRRAGNCVARFLVGGDPEGAASWGAALVDQLTIAASASGPSSGDDGWCADVLGRRVACVLAAAVDTSAADGPQGAAYQIVGPADSGDPPTLRGEVGVVQLIVGADDVVSPRSRLSMETPIPGTSLVSVVDLVPATETWCGTVTTPDGEVHRVGVSPSVASDGPVEAPAPCDDGSTGTSVETTAPPTTGIVPPPTVPPTSVPVGSDGTVLLLDGAGDVRLVDAQGMRTLYDGFDPDERPTEGEFVLVDGMALSPERDTLVVSDCCEPFPGDLIAVDVATGEHEVIGFGHLPAFTELGNLVWAGLGSTDTGELNPVVLLGDATGAVGVTLHEFPVDSRIDDLAVVPGPDGERVVVLLATPTETQLWVFPAGGGDMQLSATVADVPWTAETPMSLAGWTDEAYLVLDDANDQVLAFDRSTLVPIVGPEVPNASISLWITPTTSRSISPDRVVTIDGVAQPGEFVRVR